MTGPASDPGLARLAAAVVVTGFDGTVVPDWLLHRVDGGLGGVCWFGQNVDDVAQAQALSDRLHQTRGGVVVMSDEEGGDVTRIEAGAGSSWPGHAALGVLDDVRSTSAVAAAMGRQLRQVGVDVALAPVVDVNSNPDNPVIGVRSFGSTSETVSRHAVAFVDGLQSAGVAGCAKHFPGHGSTRTDSHLGLPTVDDPEAVLRERDLAPFAAVVRAGVRCVMTAHVVFSAFDTVPATLSRSLLHLLREELGFDGVIVSDALDMRAISAGVGHGEGAVRTLLASTDLVCIGNPAFPEPYDAEVRLDLVVAAVSQAVRDGRLPASRLEQAVHRIETLTRWIGESRVADTDVAESSLGLDVARRTIRHRGDVAVTAPVVLDLVGPVSMAAGRRDVHLRDALMRRDARITVREVGAAQDVAQALIDATARDLVVLTRSPREAPAQGLVAQVLAERPDTVVVQTGIADHASAGARTVWTHGGGRAVAEAAAELVVQGSRR